MGWVVYDCRARPYCDDEYDVVIEVPSGRVLALRTGVPLLPCYDPQSYRVLAVDLRPAWQQIVETSCSRGACPSAAQHVRSCGEEAWCDRYSLPEYDALRESYSRGESGCHRWPRGRGSGSPALKAAE